jgi:hypothetical protein
MKRSTSLLLGLSLAISTACGAPQEELLFDGEGVKSEDGKDDSSSLAVFLDFEWEGAYAVDSSPWNLRQSIQDHLLFTIGHLNGDNAVGRLDRLELSDARTVTEGGVTKVVYKAKMPVAWGDKLNPPSSYEFVLPSSMKFDAVDRFTTSYKDRCVDWSAHDVDSGSMWYYYRPLESSCTLASADVYRATASVSLSPINTTGKFPEYNKLWEDGALNVLAIFGKYEDGATSGDSGIDGYNQFINSMRIELGGLGVFTTLPATIPTNPGVAVPDVTFSATLPSGKAVRVTALLTDNVRTGLSDPAFRGRYEALSTRADLIVYNGHAGLGANVRALARSGQWVAGQYVIVFMNGCDTYAYVDSALNDAHKLVNPDDTTGTKYVDIVTNGMPSFFASMSGATMALFRGILAHDDPRTYEQIFRTVDRSQVVLVTGEADNTFTPGGGGTPVDWAGLRKSGTVARGVSRRYTTPTLAAGTYTFEMTGSGDADLYVRIGSRPTTTSFDCRPYKNGSNETCEVQLAAPAVIHTMVRGYASSSSFELVGAKL